MPADSTRDTNTKKIISVENLESFWHMSGYKSFTTHSTDVCLSSP